jgi:hypothetical protein
LLPYFRHPNYIHISGKPVFAIYRMQLIPQDVRGRMIAHWKRMAIKSGLKGLYIMAVRA